MPPRPLYGDGEGDVTQDAIDAYYALDEQEDERQVRRSSGSGATLLNPYEASGTRAQGGASSGEAPSGNDPTGGAPGARLDALSGPSGDQMQLHPPPTAPQDLDYYGVFLDPADASKSQESISAAGESFSEQPLLPDDAWMLRPPGAGGSSETLPPSDPEALTMPGALSLNEAPPYLPPEAPPYPRSDAGESEESGAHVPHEAPGAGSPTDAPEEDPVQGTGVRHGHIPQRQPRRNRTVQRIALRDGHLALDCPVPPKLLRKLPVQEGREFTHMRYTAITCDADEFAEQRYKLRPVQFEPPRRTELFIVMTMYNEDERLFARTLHGVMSNIAHLCSRSRSRMWGPDGWKRVVVCIVADGRQNVNSRTLSLLATLGVYQEGVAIGEVDGRPVQAQLYEYTTQISVDTSFKFRGQERGIVPVQVMLCLKEQNRKKINSHRWAFNAFGRVLQPHVCVQLDVGTMPRPRSIYRLWKTFDRDPHVGGACGEVVALKGMLWTGLLNPLVGAQNFEYKLSNILDKPMESACGYITVLPGAFSAYRYAALQNDALGNGPLSSYFAGETLQGGKTDADIFSSNMYLAEDRILCWELVTKRHASWVLRYVKRAQAVTDVPESVAELISQRRRWLNGSLFTAIHSIIKFGHVYRSSHSVGRKIALHIEMLYQLVQLIYSWFAMANYLCGTCQRRENHADLAAYWILTDALAKEIHALHIPTVITQYIYVIFLAFCFLLSMGNRPAGTTHGYALTMVVFALLTLYMGFAVAYLAAQSILHAIHSNSPSQMLTNHAFVSIVISVASTFGIWMIASLLFLEPWHMFTSIVQYLLLAPSFVNIINIYAFCNINDVSWGTKGMDSRRSELSAAKPARENEVDVALPTEPTDMDAAYEDACHVLASKPPKAKRVVDPATRQRDYYATVRTNVLLVWCLTNAALCIVILNVSSDMVRTIYMAVLLYSVAALALFRLIGAVAYLIQRACRRRARAPE